MVCKTQVIPVEDEPGFEVRIDTRHEYIDVRVRTWYQGERKDITAQVTALEAEFLAEAFTAAAAEIRRTEAREVAS